MMIRGNTWSLSEKYFPAASFLDVEELKVKSEQEKDEDSKSVFIYIGLATVILGFSIFALVICYAMRKNVREIDEQEIEKLLEESLIS